MLSMSRKLTPLLTLLIVSCSDMAVPLPPRSSAAQPRLQRHTAMPHIATLRSPDKSASAFPKLPNLNAASASFSYPTVRQQEENLKRRVDMYRRSIDLKTFD